MIHLRQTDSLNTCPGSNGTSEIPAKRARSQTTTTRLKNDILNDMFLEMLHYASPPRKPCYPKTKPIN